MSKSTTRTKFDSAGNPTGNKNKPARTPSQPEHVHRALAKRAHLAHELRDRNLIDEAEEMTRGLMPQLRGRAQGISDSAYKHRPFRSTKRRDILPPS